MKRLELLCALFLVLVSVAGTALAEVHENVQTALDWQLPVSDCKKPKRNVGAMQDIEDSDGVNNRFGTDSYMTSRYNRKLKRWESCIGEYRTVLLDDFKELKDSAQYGLNQEQAEIILGKLALIQSTLVSQEIFSP